jgi:hypothetical protein
MIRFWKCWAAACEHGFDVHTRCSSDFPRIDVGRTPLCKNIVKALNDYMGALANSFYLWWALVAVTTSRHEVRRTLSRGAETPVAW